MDNARHLEFRRLIAAPVTRVWRTVTEPALVSTWFTDCRRVAHDRYQLTFDDEDGAYTKQLVVLDCRPDGQRPAFRSRLEDPGYPDSVVAVRLETAVTGSEAAGTLLVLTHLSPPADLVAGYRTGWRDYLDGMARQTSGGGES
jgi:uncharacterized protein YndB with AHSA1/START domain